MAVAPEYPGQGKRTCTVAMVLQHGDMYCVIPVVASDMCTNIIRTPPRLRSAKDSCFCRDSNYDLPRSQVSDGTAYVESTRCYTSLALRFRNARIRKPPIRNIGCITRVQIIYTAVSQELHPSAHFHTSQQHDTNNAQEAAATYQLRLRYSP